MDWQVVLGIMAALGAASAFPKLWFYLRADRACGVVVDYLETTDRRQQTVWKAVVEYAPRVGELVRVSERRGSRKGPRFEKRKDVMVLYNPKKPDRVVLRKHPHDGR